MRGKKNQENNLFRQEFFSRFAEKVRGKHLYCSFSGGADSLALLLFLDHWKKEGFTLSAVHFEHGFRGEESLQDAEFCRKKCGEMKIPFRCISLHVPENLLPGEGEEAAARRLRLSRWKKIVVDPEKELIATGHHGGDVAENMLLRLFRGGNTSSVTSLRTFSTVEKMTFFRPLLTCSKAELEEFLRTNGEGSWCHDRTNAEDLYARNFLRNDVLPRIYERFPFAEKGMLSAAGALECDADFLEKSAQEIFLKFRKERYALPCLYSLHDALLIRVLRLFLDETLSPSLVPDSAMLERVKTCLRKQEEGSGRKKKGEKLLVPVSGLPGTFLDFSSGRLVPLKKEKSAPKRMQSGILCREESVLREKGVIRKKGKTFSLTLEIQEKPECLKGDNVFFFDLGKIVFPLSYTFWKGGEKMVPFGRRTPVLLKKLFANARISSSERAQYPLIADSCGKRILCAGVLRRSAWAAAGEETEEVLKITFR